MAKLIKIANCEKPERLGDVVFVHGLDGDAIKTWHPEQQPDAFWPKWLGEDFPRLGIWSLDYGAASMKWKGNSMRLVNRAANTIDALVLDDIGAAASRRLHLPQPW